MEGRIGQFGISVQFMWARFDSFESFPIISEPKSPNVSFYLFLFYPGAFLDHIIVSWARYWTFSRSQPAYRSFLASKLLNDVCLSFGLGKTADALTVPN